MNIIDPLLQYWDRLAAQYDPSRRQYLCADLGASKISVILAEKTSASIKIIAEFIGYRDSENKENWWQPKLKQWIRERQLQGKEIILASSIIPGVIRRLQIPRGASSELKSAIHWQIKDQLPFPVEEATIQYRLLGHPKSPQGEGQLDLLAVAAHRQTIEKLVDQVAEADVTVKKVSLIPLILESGVGHSPYAKQTVAVLEMGSETTSLVIMGDGNIRFHRQLQVTGRTLSDALTGGVISDSGRVDINPQRAEELKRKYGIPARGQPPTEEESPIPLDKMGVMMRPALEKLTNEIHRTLDYYRAQLHREGAKIDSLLLSGGACQLKGLGDFLKENLGIPVSPLDVSQWMKLALPPDHSARMNIAVSLALEGMSGFNLLPADYRLRRFRRVQASCLRILGITIAALLIVVYLYNAWHLQQIQSQLVSSQKALRDMSLISNLKKEIDERKEVVFAIRRGELICPALMSELSRTALPDLVLDEFRFDRKKKELSLKGFIYASAGAAEKQLSDFIKKLGVCHLISGVRLVTTQQDKRENQNGAVFEVLCELSPQQ